MAAGKSLTSKTVGKTTEKSGAKRLGKSTTKLVAKPPMVKSSSKPVVRSVSAHSAAHANADGVAEQTEIRLAERLRRLRISRRLTLEQLAQQAGLSKGYLSRIENARQLPPIATLSRIAAALNTDVNFFLQDNATQETERTSVVRVNERQPIARGASDFGYDYMSLAHKRRFKQMEPFVFKFPKVAKREVQFEHTGEEFLFVLTGKIEFEVGHADDRRAWVLEPGDSLYFDSELPHSGRGLTNNATALVVLLNPTLINLKD